MTAASHCPVGVVIFDGRVWTYEPFNNGYAVHDDKGHPCGVSDELRAAIVADEEHQKEKHK